MQRKLPVEKVEDHKSEVLNITKDNRLGNENFENLQYNPCFCSIIETTMPRCHAKLDVGSSHQPIFTSYVEMPRYSSTPKPILYTLTLLPFIIIIVDIDRRCIN